MANKRGLAVGVLLTLAALPLSAVDFDQAVPVRPLLEEARQTAKVKTEVQGGATNEKDALWVSIGKSDLETLNEGPFPLGEPILSSDRASVFRLPAERLPQLSHLMHEKFNRCGGFFTYDTKEEAAADLKPLAASAGGPYTIDQQAVIKPLMAKAAEKELRGTIDTLAAYNNRYYQSETGVAAARWLQGRWQTLAAGIPGASVRLITHASWKQPSVVLTIPGADKPEEVVVLGGHLDSINGRGGEKARAPGADDNASGIAVLTEAVRILGEARLRPRRTIEVMGYAAEEVGLRGSKDIAQQYAKKGTKVVGVIQFDMTNFKGSAEDIFILSDNVDPTLTAFLGQLIDAYVGVRWSKTKCGYGCSDHASWNNSGYPASCAFESSFNDMNRNLHTDHDSVENSGGNAQHSVSFAKLAVAFAVELAKAADGSQLSRSAAPAR